MKKSRFKDEQIVAILRKTDRDAVPAVAKRHGVSEQMISTWKKWFGSFQPDDVRRLKQLEQENGRLKKLVAERDLEIEVMREISAKNGRRAGPPRAGGVCDTPGPVAATVLHADEGGAFDARLPVGQGGPRWAGAGADGGAVGPVPALRLPAHPDLPGP